MYFLNQARFERNGTDLVADEYANFAFENHAIWTVMSIKILIGRMSSTLQRMNASILSPNQVKINQRLSTMHDRDLEFKDK